MPDINEIEHFHAALHAWYHQQGRKDLPWRNVGDPYPIWLSEVMLQQTQVKTVLERFYFPFLERFPTVHALAEAESQEVLKLWEGLGYYNRARNLHKAAQIIARQGFPQEVELLKQLPGIGQNTAHAVASFAFHKAVPVLEANVKRVVTRIAAYRTPKNAELWAAAWRLLDETQPFDYNQAMMDVGSMLCTPQAPQCGVCPARNICAGREEPEAYPQKKQKKALPVRKKKIVLFRWGEGHYYISPREGAFLHGLWQFPETDAEEQNIQFAENRYPFEAMQYVGEVAHSYSHFHLQASVYVQPIECRIDMHENWVEQSRIEELPLSRTEKKIVALLRRGCEKQGNGL